MNFSLVQHLKVGPEHRLQSWKRLTPTSVKCATECIDFVDYDSRSWQLEVLRRDRHREALIRVWSDGAVRARIEDSVHAEFTPPHVPVGVWLAQFSRPIATDRLRDLVRPSCHVCRHSSVSTLKLVGELRCKKYRDTPTYLH